MATMRVLFIWGDIRGVGGTERRMGDVTAELTRRNVTVTSFALSGHDRLPLQLLQSAKGAAVTNSRSPLALLRTWRQVRPDLVIAFGLRQSLVARGLRLLGARSKSVAVARNGLDFGWPSWIHAVDRLTSTLVDVYLANSHQVALHLAKHGISADRIAVVVSALDATWYAPTVKRDGQKVIAMIGNARAEKNHSFGLEAFLSTREKALLRVYTNNGDELRAYLRSRNATDPQARVEILENHVVTPLDLDEVDVLLHPSLSESLPRTVLEASARGCWIVASDAGDTRAHVSSDNAIVLSEFDVSTYAAALDTMLRRARHQGGELNNGARGVGEYVDELFRACGLQA